MRLLNTLPNPLRTTLVLISQPRNALLTYSGVVVSAPEAAKPYYLPAGYSGGGGFEWADGGGHLSWLRAPTSGW